MDTLLLDTILWDVCLDASGNIALASNPYALAQDAASAIRLFKSELYYDTTQGVPYFQEILGKYPSISLMKARFESAALTVPEVVESYCVITDLKLRRLTGQVQISDTAGNISKVNF